MVDCLLIGMQKDAEQNPKAPINASDCLISLFSFYGAFIEHAIIVCLFLYGLLGFLFVLII